jgi:Leucine-rich repeat (LRR) protein
MFRLISSKMIYPDISLPLPLSPRLSLSNNSLPTSIAKLSMLKSLAIDNNLLAALSPRVCDLSSLERLTVDNNQLRFLPPKLGDLPALTLCEKIDNLSECSVDFFWMHNLVHFIAPYIPTPPSFQSSFRSLSTPPPSPLFLTIYFTEDPLPPFSFTVSAANNRLTMLPASLATIAPLRSISLMGNPLAPLPPALRERTDIELDIDRNL